MLLTRRINLYILCITVHVDLLKVVSFFSLLHREPLRRPVAPPPPPRPVAHLVPNNRSVNLTVPVLRHTYLPPERLAPVGCASTVIANKEGKLCMQKDPFFVHCKGNVSKLVLFWTNTLAMSPPNRLIDLLYNDMNQFYSPVFKECLSVCFNVVHRVRQWCVRYGVVILGLVDILKNITNIFFLTGIK